MKGTPQFRSSLRWLVITTACIVAAACSGKQPVRVGFAAELTGRQAELGVQERDGVQLAVETINAAGGVAGRPIELIVRDDLGTAEGAQAVDRELIAAGVAAIIGHATSAQAKAAIPVIDAAHTVLLSPTASSPTLSGASPYFFRATISNRVRVHALAQHIHQRYRTPKMAVIFDADNMAYSKAYVDTFTERYRSVGGKVVAALAFSSAGQPDFAGLLATLRDSSADGLLIVASDFDTALIAQRSRLIGWTPRLFTTGWAQSEVLLHNGGKSVEGIELEQSFPSDGQSARLKDFQSRYRSRFGREPSFGAMFGYESALVLAAALEKTKGQRSGLRESLLALRDFQGLIDTIASFDTRGDVRRPFYIGSVRDGRFVTVESFQSADP